jgi:hypothetical protein
MLRIDVGSRPKSAAEVMERLLPLLGAPPDDELRAARAYLVTPKLVGRDDVIARFRRQMLRAVRGHGGGFAVVGSEGAGRSRMLDAFVLEAKLVGATTARAGREEGARPFGVAASIAAQIHRSAPGAALAVAKSDPKMASVLFPGAHENSDPNTAVLADITRSALDRAELQAALRTWILELAARRPLAIAVDDFDRIDEPSAALVASLTRASSTRRLMYLAVVPSGPAAATTGPVDVLRGHAEEIRLEPLGADQVKALFASLFGNVPNLGVLSNRVTALAGGRPRECMMFAQHLVDAGAITYAGGSWALPATIPDTLLPATIESAFALRVAQLRPLARRIAGMLTENLVERLSRADLLSAALAPAAAVDAALDALIAANLVAGDPSGYVLTGEAVARLLSASLSDDEKRRIHGHLATLHERAGRHDLLVAYHEVSGLRSERGLERIASRTRNTEERSVFVIEGTQSVRESHAAHALLLATRTAERLGRPLFELQSLRGMLASMAARGADPACFYEVADTWLRQAKIDSGWDDWHRLDPTLDPGTRAFMAVGAAMQRYNETNPEDRSQSPQEGIQQLVAYVLFAIAIAARLMDRELLASLPDILVPFAPLNPMIAAILADAHACLLHNQGQKELAKVAFLEVMEHLDSVTGAELRYVDSVRGAVCYVLAAIDVAFGVPSPWLSRYAELEDRNQRVSALFLQKVAALQQGDWELAEKYRNDAELLSLQMNAPSMFSTLPDEVEVHALARDLTGLRQVRAAIRAIAEGRPGWRAMQDVADAHYLRLCGDLEGALAALSPALMAGEEQANHLAWISAGRRLAVQVLCDLGRADDALALGLVELARCATQSMDHSARVLSLSIATAEAMLGRGAAARQRVEKVISEQAALGVVGLQLGYSYEIAARIAIIEREADAFRRFAALAAEQYRPGKSAVLGQLYERLMDEGRNAGFVDASSAEVRHALREAAWSSNTDLALLIAEGENPRERAERALGLLCDGDPPTRGHLLVTREGGLVLAASNTPCTSMTEIVAFATACLDRESQANNMETGAIPADALGTLSAEWRDTEGTDYEIVLLATTISDTFCIGGVALLAKRGEPRAGRLATLADAIARTLITSGDAISVAAA